jgi:NitT/TauT family transport system substrate-binding protein
MHLTSAALFHQKGIPTRFLGASLGNVLHVITRQPVEDGMQGLVGKTIAIPMRGEYPDIMFRTLLDKVGLSDSIQIRYTATSQDAANQLQAGAVDAALVAQPHFSILMKRLDGKAVLHHAVDMQEAWNDANMTTSPLVTAGLVAVGSVLQDSEMLESVWRAYQEAADWCLLHPSEATGLLGASLPDGAARDATTNAFLSAARHPIPSGVERPLLEQYMGIFRAFAPESFGDSIPSDDFFWYPEVGGNQSQ